MADRGEYINKTNRDILVDIRVDQAVIKSELGHIKSKVTSIEDELTDHKKNVWPKVDAHEKYINTQKGMSMGRMQFWGIVVAIAVIMIAVLGLYVKTTG